MAAHTPGPWKVDISPVRKSLCVLASDAWICGELSNGDGENAGEGEANAALIAAAPEMLAALKAVVRVADRQTVEFDLARAAILKAEGR